MGMPVSLDSEDKNLEEIVRRIVKTFNPERIVLFGSKVRGEADENSDVDLLVVLSFQGSKFDMTMKLREATADISVAKDIVPVTPEEFRKYKDYPGTIVRPAHLEGKVLYEREA